jgi:hypothetical protein
MWQDPEESPAVRQLLRAGRASQYAKDYDVERGLARHLANLSAGAPVPSWYTGVAGVTAAAATTAAVQKGATSSLLAWLVPPVVGAGLVSAWLWVHPSEPPKPSPVAKATTTAAAVSEHAATALPPSAAATPRELARVVSADGDDVARERRQTRSSRRVVTSRAPAHRELASAHARRFTASEGEGAPSERGPFGSGSGVASSAPVGAQAAVIISTQQNSAARTTEATHPAPQPTAAAAGPEQPRPQAQAQAREPAAAPAPRVESDSKLEREMQMLAVAQRILNSDPARALRLTRQGEQEFGKSMFSAERKQVSLLALVQLGRLDEARRLGVPFLRAYPKAPWSARLREALATGRLPER